MVFNVHKPDVLYDVIRAKNKSRKNDHWDDDMKLVDRNIGDEYQSFLRTILQKAGSNEPHKRERENIMGIETRYKGYYQTGSSKKIKVEKVVKGKNVVEIASPRNNEVTENQLVPLGVYSDYRNQVLYEMGKPYNREKYYQLKHDVQVRKPIERHMDLRNGRERSYSFNKYGKSLFDHYPGLVSQ